MNGLIVPASLVETEQGEAAAAPDVQTAQADETSADETVTDEAGTDEAGTDETTADGTGTDEDASAIESAAEGQPEVQSLPQPPLPSADLGASPLTGPVVAAVDAAVPAEIADALKTKLAASPSISENGSQQPLSQTDSADQATTLITVAGNASSAPWIAERYFAPVVPFNTVQDDISLAELTERWQGASTVYTTDEGWGLLPAVLGRAGDSTQVVSLEDLRPAVEADATAIGILPFDKLDPRYKVLSVDGVNVLNNHLDPATYPLVARLAVTGAGANAVNSLLQGVVEPATNRDASRITALVMTGVTAMARGTADAIERSGDDAYPARVIGPELAQADITHVSNEIPFLEGCEVWNFEDNLTLCSDPRYWAALEMIGTDIVGLSGNHVNDFGYDGARESLTWYKDHNIPIYGSGFTPEEACAPLLWKSNGNTFAFFAALAYEPSSAWVTDTEPGACYYYDHKDEIIKAIGELSKEVDVVAVELQYEETYFPYPTESQVTEFRELRDAGADLVTGVQSHVPQAQEPYGRYDKGGPGMISYGLGNLFFDQMWSWETRTELYLRHTIYDGQIISSEILTGILEDYAQPRWATPEERAELLQTVFDGEPER